MIFLPALLAWSIHIFLRPRETGRKKKLFYLAFYFILINTFTFAVSFLRGVRGLRFDGMTMTYKIKYLCMGCVWVIFKASEPYFPVFIFIGLTMWGFFSRCVSGSVNLIRSNRSIITRIYMPKFILLFSRMLVCGFKMMISFGVVVFMMLVFRVRPTVNIFGMIPILAVFFLFTFGLCNIFMHYGVYVNDLAYIVGIVLTMLMYLTGVFYDVGKRIPAPFGELMEKYNPIAFLISSMRGALLYGQAPDWMMLGMWTLVSLLLTMVGVSTIYRNENGYVKVI